MFADVLLYAGILLLLYACFGKAIVFSRASAVVESPVMVVAEITVKAQRKPKQKKSVAAPSHWNTLI